MIKVLIVDDHEMVRLGLATYIGSNLIWKWLIRPKTVKRVSIWHLKIGLILF